ncbi:hypothetical protein [Alkaliphilus peptidifermentans]|nr:hypothetical protein [Alkaliphilus peptidifermentans]
MSKTSLIELRIILESRFKNPVSRTATARGLVKNSLLINKLRIIANE